MTEKLISIDEVLAFGQNLGVLKKQKPALVRQLTRYRQDGGSNYPNDISVLYNLTFKELSRGRRGKQRFQEQTGMTFDPFNFRKAFNGKYFDPNRANLPLAISKQI